MHLRIRLLKPDLHHYCSRVYAFALAEPIFLFATSRDGGVREEVRADGKQHLSTSYNQIYFAADI